MKRWALIAGCAIFLAGLWWGLWHPANRIHVESPLVHQSAPTQHASWYLAENKAFPAVLQGKMTLVHFFASWCAYCRAEMPVWLDIAADSHIQVQRIGVAYKDQRVPLRTFLARYGEPFQGIVWDPQGKLALAWGVYGTPETFLVNSKGEIVAKWVGPISPDMWTEQVKPLIQRGIAA